MSSTAVILIFLAFGVSVVRSDGLCLQCTDVKNACECYNATTCLPNQTCSAMADNTPNGIVYRYQCSDKELCKANFSALVRPDVPPSRFEQELCMQCCNDTTDYCNRELCPIPKPPMDMGEQSCRDHEEDGIKCSVLDFAQICTDQSMLANVMMRKKCPVTCGLCKPVSNANTSYVARPAGIVCEDFEHDGITCAQLDLLDVCTSKTSLAVMVAHEKCQKHCGICRTSTTAPIVPAATTTTPALNSKTTTTTTTAVTTISSKTSLSTNLPAPTTTLQTTTTTPVATTTPTPTTTAEPCVDDESGGFNCTEWESHGYCLPFPGPGYETAKQRCRKHCGFCTVQIITGKWSLQNRTEGIC